MQLRTLKSTDTLKSRFPASKAKVVCCVSRISILPKGIYDVSINEIVESMKGISVIVVEAADDAERKRVEYVLEKWRRNASRLKTPYALKALRRLS